ncbi:MAG: hypothetical protein RBR48_02040 [Bacilli bacterium]|nr:hypothetical protein [Bacilli bacterium]
MKKQEIIEITTPEMPKDNPDLKVDISEVYFESANQTKNYHFSPSITSQDEKREQINIDLANFEEKLTTMLHLYHFFNLFSVAVVDKETFTSAQKDIDKYVMQLVKKYEALKKANNSLKRKKLLTEEMVHELYYEVGDLEKYYYDLMEDLTNYKKDYFPNLKMASYTFCNEKTYQELEEYTKYVTDEISKYSSLQDAYDYVCYHSGELITKTITNLLAFMKRGLTKNYVSNFTIDYFLENEIIMYYDYSKWIGLFSKINYVIKKSDKAIFTDKNFISSYQELEHKYVIVLIYNECHTTRRA